MRLILASQSSSDRTNLSPTGERLINCYAMPAPEGSISPIVIRSVPGMIPYQTVPGPLVRDLARVGGNLYAVASGGLYRLGSRGNIAYLGAVPDDQNTSISGHGSSVVVSAGGSYYVWDGSNLTSPGGGAVVSVGSVAFLDNFTLIGERDGRKVEWTAAGLPQTRNGLYFATAEARDDKIIRIIDAGPHLIVLKEYSTELWANTGLGAESAFIRVQGAVIDQGLKDFNLVCKVPDGAFCIGGDNVARLFQGGSPTEVSTSVVNQSLKDGDPTHCFYYEDRGQRFCVIRFSDRPAWVYDMSMGAWHERSKGPDHAPWDIVCSAYCYNAWFLGDRQGRVYKVFNLPQDAGERIRRTIISRPLFAEGSPITVSSLEFMGLFGNYSVEEVSPNWVTDELGFPITDQEGRPILAQTPQSVQTFRRPGKAWFRFSGDGGRTWGRARTKTIGRVGDSDVVVRFVALGQFKRSFTAEVNFTDPVDVPLLGEALVEVS